MSQLEDSTGSLSEISRVLTLSWNDSVSGWNDDVRTEFETTHWSNIESELHAVTNSLNTLSQSITTSYDEISQHAEIIEQLQQDVSNQMNDTNLNPNC